MEGFKKFPKVQCFKEGGQVGYKPRNNHAEEKEMAKDVAQDKALVKKGVAQHEAAKHKGEPKTELKLKCGGRAKKETGTVKKYKAGGAIGMQKDKADKKEIAKTKAAAAAPKKKAPKTIQQPAPAAEMAPAELPVPQELPAFQAGGYLGRLRDNIMGTPQQNAEAKKRLDKMAQENSRLGATERSIRSLQGQGEAAASDGLGQANPEGPERELMNGLRAVGRCVGGKV